ncbi:DUF1588 domain-containing protein [bacterium]|nr:DUF1588 domain-containing protein [bacterium]
MNRFTIAFTLLIFGSSGFFEAQKANAEETYTPGQRVNETFNDFAQVFLNDYCLDCHDSDSQKGDLSLEDLGPVDETNADTWKTVWAQVTLKEMPPKKKRNQPNVVDRLRFSDWIIGEMQRIMRDQGGFRAHLDPGKGNFVDHDLLFGPLPDGIKLVPTSSPARLWRVTPEEHITRINELINREPEFDPAKPGLRTNGDVVPTNHGGELKLYFGTDRIVKWTGGTVAYATAVKAVPAVLSSSRVHGLDKYPDFYTVNSAEATQIIGLAEDVIRYMADGPLSIAEPWQITDNGKDYDKDKPSGDIRGLPISIMYSTKVMRPLTPVHDLMQAESDVDELLRAAVEYLFEALTFRPASKTESDAYLAIVRQSIEKLGKKDGAVLGLSSIFLDRDALFRAELVENGEPDAYGRFMLQDWELGLAVNHALRYIKPDEELRKVIVEGRMRDRADVQREVERMLGDDRIRKPRLLRFFREYFDYDRGGYICKDTKALADTGAGAAGAAHYRAMFDATASTDRLIEFILHEDKDVLNQLLTTDKVVATKRDNVFFGIRRTESEIATSVAAAKEALKEQIRKEAAALESAEKEVADLEAMLGASPGDKTIQRTLTAKKRALAAAKRQAVAAKRKRNNINHKVTEADLSGPKIFARVSRRSFGNGTLKPERFLATAPEGQRLGILTHPSWLISHSDAMDNHAIHRGRWIRERLLGGGIPDVPITVDAMLPDEPEHTLRERMRVTTENYCWTCHKKMDPLGLPFEMYNHAGLYRETELNKPIDTTGEITDSGNPSLDGKVANAIEMIQKLAESERVEQVFIRHAFRFWMGRNETINDAPVLQEAYHSYKKSGGSMKALLVSLLTSDAFLFRTKGEPGQGTQ